MLRSYDIFSVFLQEKEVIPERQIPQTNKQKKTLREYTFHSINIYNLLF